MQIALQRLTIIGVNRDVQQSVSTNESFLTIECFAILKFAVFALGCEVAVVQLKWGITVDTSSELVNVQSCTAP